LFCPWFDFVVGAALFYWLTRYAETWFFYTTALLFLVGTIMGSELLHPGQTRALIIAQ
jgi:hypothetical protein